MEEDKRRQDIDELNEVHPVTPVAPIQDASNPKHRSCDSSDHETEWGWTADKDGYSDAVREVLDAQPKPYERRYARNEHERNRDLERNVSASFNRLVHC